MDDPIKKVWRAQNPKNMVRVVCLNPLSTPAKDSHKSKRRPAGYIDTKTHTVVAAIRAVMLSSVCTTTRSLAFLSVSAFEPPPYASAGLGCVSLRRERCRCVDCKPIHSSTESCIAKKRKHWCTLLLGSTTALNFSRACFQGERRTTFGG